MKKMKKFRVRVVYDGHYDVEAMNEEDAYDKAMNEGGWESFEVDEETTEDISEIDDNGHRVNLDK